MGGFVPRRHHPPRFREIIKANRVPLQQTDHIEAVFSDTL